MSRQELRRKRGNFTIIENELIDCDQLTSHQKLIYMVLCRFANSETDKAFPSYSTIAKRAGCSRGQAVASVQGLVDNHLVLCEKGGPKGRTANIYTILPPEEWGVDLPSYPQASGHNMTTSGQGEPQSGQEVDSNKTRENKTKEKEGEAPPSIQYKGLKIQGDLKTMVDRFTAQYGLDNINRILDDYKKAKSPEQYTFIDKDLPHFLDRWKIAHQDQKWENGEKIANRAAGGQWAYFPGKKPAEQ